MPDERDEIEFGVDVMKRRNGVAVWLARPMRKSIHLLVLELETGL